MMSIANQKPRLARRAVTVAVCLTMLCPLAAMAVAAVSTPDLAALLASRDTMVQVEWAQRYENAEGVPRDAAAAIKLYCHAANAGSTEAAYDLGWLYANARGVPRDDSLAAAWFQIAAKHGDPYARRMLPRMNATAPLPDASCRLPNGSQYALHQVISSVPNPSPQLVTRWVRALAPEYRLDPALVLAVIRAESNFNPHARSPKDARGLMQLIPDTAKRFGVSDIWDPVQNLRGGMAYLRWLLDYFKGDMRLALAGYNAGEQAVVSYGGVPPYDETQNYLQRILAQLASAN